MPEMIGDNAEALRFLRWLRPGGPWVLTAIAPVGGLIRTETLDREERVLDFLDMWNGKRNLYFMVNPATRSIDSKAKKEDVASMDLLHVDVDPAKGADPAVERARILGVLQAFCPPPSAIIDSGGGYQGFWRLDEPLHIGGDLTRAADAEAYNRQLEVLLGGDHCHNCDRVMRVPGTVNLPNEKKRKAGRVEALARLLLIDDKRVYPLHEFTAAPRVQAAGPALGAAGRVTIPSNLPTVLIDDLPDTVTQRTRMLIVQGEDPDDQTRYASGSEAVFAVCCAMVRAGCADEVTASVLLDKDYGISAHILKQRRPDEYAARQIQRAKEHVVEPRLVTMNETHAVIADLGGKCRVISEVMDLGLPRPRMRISKQSFDDFRNRYMHVRVEIGKDDKGNQLYKKLGNWWLEHPLRRQFTSIVFAPNRDVVDSYNLWQGFACEAIPGRGHERFLAHLRDNICSGNEAHLHYLISWMARAVQRPGEAGQVAVVLRGGKGTGKGTVPSVFGSLWGRHYLHISSPKHLVGQFNAHLRDCVLVFADEAFFAGDKQHESVLMTLITESTLMIEGKGVDAEVAPNYTHLIMASNSHWVVPAGPDERRYYVIDVGDGAKQDTAYFRDLHADMENGGRESLLHYLLGYDISGYNVWDVPQTEALQDQKLFNMAGEEQWWLERLRDGRTTAVGADWSTSISKEQLKNDYLAYMDAQKIFRRVSPTALGKFLARVMPAGFPVSTQRVADVEKVDGHGQVDVRRERVYFYDLPDLDECRASWATRFGPTSWPADEADKASGIRDNDYPY